MRGKAKKLAVLLMTAALAVSSLTAAFGAEKKEYQFTYNKKQYTVGMEAKTAMDALGKAESSRDVNNCANGYVNKAYMYGDKAFEVYVEQSGGKEIVANITLLSDKAATEEGLKPGDSESRVTEVYPDAQKGLGSYSTVLGNVKLYIKMKDHKVNYISYLQAKE